MADWEKKEGKMNIQTFEYLKNKKSFLDELKNIFHSGYQLVKNKNPIKIGGYQLLNRPCIT